MTRTALTDVRLVYWLGFNILLVAINLVVGVPLQNTLIDQGYFLLGSVITAMAWKVR